MSADSAGKLTPGRLAANLCLTANTVREHLGDDPVVLALQVARRLPSAPVSVAAALAARLGRADASVVGAIAHVVRGHEQTAAERIERARAHQLSPERARKLADVATAMAEIDLAERLLDGLPSSARVATSAARLAWHRGQMSEAVALLAPYASGPQRDRAAATLHGRLASELATFSGRRPRVEAPESYAPVAHRVLHMATNSLPHTGSGYAQRTHSILVALREAGWEVAAATRLGYPVQVGKPWAADVDVVDGIEYRRMLPSRLAAGFDARLQQQAEELARMVEEFRPAILHTTTHFVNGLVVRAVAEAYGLRWVYEARGQLADTWASTRGPAAKDSERYRLFKEREAEVARHADAVVTLGEAMRTELIGQGVSAERLEICPNAVGESFLAEPGGTTAARQELGLPAQGLYVGTVSSIVGYEGLDTLVEAFALLAAERGDIRLLIAGDGAALPGLKHRVAQLGLGDRVIFPGRIPRPQASTYHQALDVFSVPRKDLEVTRQVTPLKLVEASASRRPVVASNLPALAELVEDSVTGYLAAPEDPADLAAKIGTFFDDAALRERFGQAGRAWALADRTWEANAAKYTAVYERLGGTRSTV
ncbi:glycosyltransferase family 4 protein [Zhihengliuella flava]|uniref:D-inositol 3-phosphate glycosyltransferase n=1 Tax=Zhihengliuella flava TaxID=1285193 RepID=A0A931DB75_9MICC|nr:glycosyltransferase family 4 protein [Zhihengliuella flava]MBG6083520.1 glycosyltransferase involved in cell wall biosynthesis [Zhihengliuella flava]